MKSENIQYRTAPTPIEAKAPEQRQAQGGQMVLTGYAAVFNEPTSLGRFNEVITPEAFEAANMEDVRFLIDHSGVPLGRTSAGTMELATDARGLRYRVTLPETARARELYEAVRRGDISQSSFAFRIGREDWEQREGRLTRFVRSISVVLDASAVTFPAYEQTTVEALPFG